jgi:hypothetical protein
MKKSAFLFASVMTALGQVRIPSDGDQRSEVMAIAIPK